MSLSARDLQARQRRIRESDRRIKLKALIQKQKDELRAQLRKERRQKKVEDNITHSDNDSNVDCATEEDDICSNREDEKRDTGFLLSCFLGFILM